MLSNPINFQKWINENRDKLKPPVCNHVIYNDSDFIIMVVGGPNQRNDFHVNQQDEFFYQIEGNMALKVIEDNQCKTIKINEDEIFMLPGKVPHSPQRFENSIGLVIEHKRAADMQDGFQWYCPSCNKLLYEEYLHVSDIVKQLPLVFKNFHQDQANSYCSDCDIRID